MLMTSMAENNGHKEEKIYQILSKVDVFLEKCKKSPPVQGILKSVTNSRIVSNNTGRIVSNNTGHLAVPKFPSKGYC